MTPCLSTFMSQRLFLLLSSSWRMFVLSGNFSPLMLLLFLFTLSLPQNLISATPFSSMFPQQTCLNSNESRTLPSALCSIFTLVPMWHNTIMTFTGSLWISEFTLKFFLLSSSVSTAWHLLHWLQKSNYLHLLTCSLTPHSSFRSLLLVKEPFLTMLLAVGMLSQDVYVLSLASTHSKLTWNTIFSPTSLPTYTLLTLTPDLVSYLYCFLYLSSFSVYSLIVFASFLHITLSFKLSHFLVQPFLPTIFFLLSSHLPSFFTFLTNFSLPLNTHPLLSLCSSWLWKHRAGDLSVLPPQVTDCLARKSLFHSFIHSIRQEYTKE